MAWNKTDNKSLDNQGQKSAFGPGGTVAQNSAYVGKGYRDPWDIERAYREGMQKVTWVARCIDAIAGNQARLPIILRKDNSPEGMIVKGKAAKNSSLLDILNTKSNIGENSFIFRYRVSSQLLLGTRGVFIEKVRGRDGGVIGLNLLPPQSTSPIPDPKTFVSGYEVLMPNGDKVIMKPDDVCWIRRPHPIDPYLSLTPMESAGIAIEIENLAKLYNRNYLLNDGRPGGLLVLRGEIDDDDKDELRNRFRGNLGRVGQTTVISADDGVDFVDTSSNPRDAAYIQMRQITKEEILSSFGVPESVIGNAAGRTFSNASEEIRVFWNETMSPHLEVLARAFDELDPEHYVDFDTSTVPVLIIAKQEVERYLLEELRAGLISVNEYRTGTGRKDVEADLADSLLMNPNLTPIANTKKPMAPAQPGMPMPGAGGPGMPPGAPGMPPGAPGMPPGMPGGDMAAMPPDMAAGAPPDPTTMAGAMAMEAMGGAAPQQPMPGGAPQGMGMMSAVSSEILTKDDPSETSLSRWTEILDRGIERVLERMQRVVLEKMSGQKSRKSLMQGSLDVDSVFSREIWYKQLDEDIKPVLSTIIRDSQALYSEKSDGYNIPAAQDTVINIDSQMIRIKEIIDNIHSQVSSAIYNSYGIQDESARTSALRSSVTSIFIDAIANARPRIASGEARRAWEFSRP
jgi:HK97 family phage portal protein